MRTLSSNPMQLVSVRGACSNQCCGRFTATGENCESSPLAVFYLGSANLSQNILAGKIINCD